MDKLWENEGLDLRYSNTLYIPHDSHVFNMHQLNKMYGSCKDCVCYGQRIAYIHVCSIHELSSSVVRLSSTSELLTIKKVGTALDTQQGKQANLPLHL